MIFRLPKDKKRNLKKLILPDYLLTVATFFIIGRIITPQVLAQGGVYFPPPGYSPGGYTAPWVEQYIPPQNTPPDSGTITGPESMTIVVDPYTQDLTIDYSPIGGMGTVGLAQGSGGIDGTNNPYDPSNYGPEPGSPINPGDTQTKSDSAGGQETGFDPGIDYSPIGGMGSVGPAQGANNTDGSGSPGSTAAGGGTGVTTTVDSYGSTPATLSLSSTGQNQSPIQTGNSNPFSGTTVGITIDYSSFPNIPSTTDYSKTTEMPFDPNMLSLNSSQENLKNVVDWVKTASPEQKIDLIKSLNEENLINALEVVETVIMQGPPQQGDVYHELYKATGNPTAEMFAGLYGMDPNKPNIEQGLITATSLTFSNPSYFSDEGKQMAGVTQRLAVGVQRANPSALTPDRIGSMKPFGSVSENIFIDYIKGFMDPVPPIAQTNPEAYAAIGGFSAPAQGSSSQMPDPGISLQRIIDPVTGQVTYYDPQTNLNLNPGTGENTNPSGYTGGGYITASQAEALTQQQVTYSGGPGSDAIPDDQAGAYQTVTFEQTNTAAAALAENNMIDYSVIGGLGPVGPAQGASQDPSQTTEQSSPAQSQNTSPPENLYNSTPATLSFGSGSESLPGIGNTVTYGGKMVGYGQTSPVYGPLSYTSDDPSAEEQAMMLLALSPGIGLVAGYAAPGVVGAIAAAPATYLDLSISAWGAYHAAPILPEAVAYLTALGVEAYTYASLLKDLTGLTSCATGGCAGGEDMPDEVKYLSSANTAGYKIYALPGEIDQAANNLAKIGSNIANILSSRADGSGTPYAFDGVNYYDEWGNVVATSGSGTNPSGYTGGGYITATQADIITNQSGNQGISDDAMNAFFNSGETTTSDSSTSITYSGVYEDPYAPGFETSYSLPTQSGETVNTNTISLSASSSHLGGGPSGSIPPTESHESTSYTKTDNNDGTFTYKDSDSNETTIHDSNLGSGALDKEGNWRQFDDTYKRDDPGWQY